MTQPERFLFVVDFDQIYNIRYWNNYISVTAVTRIFAIHSQAWHHFGLRHIKGGVHGGG